MKKLVLILAMMMTLGASAGTLVRDVVTTSALWRRAFTNETTQASEAALGMAPEYLINSTTNIVFTASTNAQFSSLLSLTLETGTYYTACGTFGSTLSPSNTVYGFESADGTINIMSMTNNTGSNTIGFLVVTNSQSYGFYTQQLGLDTNNPPTISSNSFCLLKKVQ